MPIVRKRALSEEDNRLNAPAYKRSKSGLKQLWEFDNIGYEQDHFHSLYRSIPNTLEELQRVLTKEIGSFLNGKGGILCFGCRPNGTVYGEPLPRGEEDKMKLVIDDIFKRFRPMVQPQRTRVTCTHVFRRYCNIQHRTVVEIRVQAGDNYEMYDDHYHETYLRKGNAPYGPLKPHEIKRLTTQQLRQKFAALRPIQSALLSPTRGTTLPAKATPPNKPVENTKFRIKRRQRKESSGSEEDPILVAVVRPVAHSQQREQPKQLPSQGAVKTGEKKGEKKEERGERKVTNIDWPVDNGDVEEGEIFEKPGVKKFPLATKSSDQGPSLSSGKQSVGKALQARAPSLPHPLAHSVRSATAAKPSTSSSSGVAVKSSSKKPMTSSSNPKSMTSSAKLNSTASSKSTAMTSSNAKTSSSSAKLPAIKSSSMTSSSKSTGAHANIDDVIVISDEYDDDDVIVSSKAPLSAPQAVRVTRSRSKGINSSATKPSSQPRSATKVNSAQAEAVNKSSSVPSRSASKTSSSTPGNVNPITAVPAAAVVSTGGSKMSDRSSAGNSGTRSVVSVAAGETKKPAAGTVSSGPAAKMGKIDVTKSTKSATRSRSTTKGNSTASNGSAKTNSAAVSTSSKGSATSSAKAAVKTTAVAAKTASNSSGKGPVTRSTAKKSTVASSSSKTSAETIGKASVCAVKANQTNSTSKGTSASTSIKTKEGSVASFSKASVICAPSKAATIEPKATPVTMTKVEPAKPVMKSNCVREVSPFSATSSGPATTAVVGTCAAGTATATTTKLVSQTSLTANVGSITIKPIATITPSMKPASLTGQTGLTTTATKPTKPLPPAVTTTKPTATRSTTTTKPAPQKPFPAKSTKSSAAFAFGSSSQRFGPPSSSLHPYKHYRTSGYGLSTAPPPPPQYYPPPSPYAYSTHHYPPNNAHYGSAYYPSLAQAAWNASTNQLRQHWH